MSTLLFGHLANGGAVPADQNIVRRTTAPVDVAAPAAEADAPPDPNQVETDDNPSLGLTNRTLASAWTQGSKDVPAWLPEVNANHEHNDIVDRQVSSSGVAAAKEATGQWGHGTLSFAEGIEPVGDLSGGRFGNEYFEANAQGANESAGRYMTPSTGNPRLNGGVAATDKDLARDAANAGQYSTWYNNMMGM